MEGELSSLRPHTLIKRETEQQVHRGTLLNGPEVVAGRPRPEPIACSNPEPVMSQRPLAARTAASPQRAMGSGIGRPATTSKPFSRLHSVDLLLSGRPYGIPEALDNFISTIPPAEYSHGTT